MNHSKVLFSLLFMILLLLLVSGFAVVSAETQNAMWFMDDMNFTQLPGGDYSHSGTLNFDVVGTSNQNIKAPFNCEIVQIYTGYDAGNTVIIQSTAPVKYANGTVDYMSMAFAHDNDISDCYVGRVIGQGQVFLQNGNYGNVTGVHSHVTVISGKYTDHPGWVQVSTGNWTFNNGIHPVDALFISDTTNIVNTMGLSFKKATTSVVLDVNGFLDGSLSGDLGSYGTCDVYINGTLVADDRNDYAVEWPVGTRYQITDIKAKDGYKYEDVYSGSLSGTLGTSRVNVVLKYTSYATLDVKGLLDNVSSGSVSGFGKFDVYINGTLDAIEVNDYYKKWPQGTTYQIKNIQTEEGKYYNGLTTGSLSGTLGKGITTVTMSMSTIVQAGPDWREETSLPGYIDPSTVEVQYNNHYEKIATSSPGAGWTQVAGSGVTTYVNSGSVYDSDFALETSNTRLHVGTYYYHYCGYSNWVEHYQTGAYTTYHTCGTDNLAEVATYTDDADSRYTVYRLQWTAGQWAGGAALCASENSDLWYKRYQYQDRTAVTNYKWTKDSGWVSTKDFTATSTMVRFRLKRYDVTFDANGGVNAPENQVKYHGVDLELTNNIPEMPAFGFKGWNTQADGKGTAYAAGSLYTENESITLYAQWEALTRLVLPAGTTAIEEQAFEGIGAAIIEVPDGCLSIGMEAFRDCENLVQIYIPASVRSISFDAFDGCDKLTVFAPENSTAIKLAKALGLNYEIIE